MMKQFVVESAYDNNVSITLFEDGVEKGYQIVSLYSLDDCKKILNMFGYNQAYNLEKCKEKLKDAEADYIEAQEEFEKAINNQLYVPKLDN